MSLTGMFDAQGLKSVSCGPEMQGSWSLERTSIDKMDGVGSGLYDFFAGRVLSEDSFMMNAGCGQGDDSTVRCGCPGGDEYGLFCADSRVCLCCMIGVWRCEQPE